MSSTTEQVTNLPKFNLEVFNAQLTSLLSAVNSSAVNFSNLSTNTQTEIKTQLGQVATYIESVDLLSFPLDIKASIENSLGGLAKNNKPTWANLEKIAFNLIGVSALLILNPITNPTGILVYKSIISILGVINISQPPLEGDDAQI